MSAAQLLKRLACAPHHNRVALAAHFDVSDEVLGQWLGELSAQGVAVSCAGTVVALQTDIDWLDLGCVKQHSKQPFKVELSLETESTNADLQHRGSQACIHQLALTTEHQRAGRGRLGRVWQSPIAQNIALSVGWQFNRSAMSLEGLSLAVGAALAQALERSFGVSLSLKWPNDLYLNDCKCGGILVDVSGDLTQSCTVIVGVGLNVAITRQAGDTIDQPWAALSSMIEGDVSRSAILGVMLDALSAALQSYETGGFEQWRASFSARDWLAGQAVIIEGGTEMTGRAAGVNSEGAMLVQTAEGVLPIYAGEARLARRSVASPNAPDFAAPSRYDR